MLIKLVTCGRERERGGSGDFSGCLAKCYSWAKGFGWARAAQLVVECTCLQDHILKVSDQYPKFWLIFKGFLIKWLAYYMREREKDERYE